MENYLDKSKRCVKCGICQADCPTYLATGNEAMAARGKLALVEAVIDGDIEPSERFSDYISKCASCMSCVSNCPRGIDSVKIINAARNEYFIKSGSDFVSKLLLKNFSGSGKALAPMFKLLGMASKVIYNSVPVEGWLKEFIPFVRDGLKKKMPQFGKRYLKNELPEIIKVKNPKMRVVFFTGCMTDYVYQEEGHTIINILKANNIETILPGEITCCGAPAYYMGDHKSALTMAELNHNILARFHPDFIVVNCATCGNMLKSVYKTLLNLNGGSSGIEDRVIDIHSFLLNQIDLPKTKLPFNNKVKVTYHDPCHLKRGQNVYLEPRKILKSLPWVDFVEMNEPDACCGGAGGFNLKHYDLSLKIGKRKAESIKETGADIVVTGCPSCRMQITDILNRAEYNRPVIHTVELLDPDNLIKITG